MIHYNTLVLNSGIPHQVRPWEKELANVFDGESIILEEYEEFPLHRAGEIFVMNCPAVTLLKNHVSKTPIPKYSKQNIHQRDEYICQYCGEFLDEEKSRELDHIVPKATKKTGGFLGSTYENVVTACPRCNRQKGQKFLKDMRHEKTWNGQPFQLIKKPERPVQRIGFARFVVMINKHNLMWIPYIPKWEYYAVRCGKAWLIDAYAEYEAKRKEKSLIV
jgi:5-methylcytosine-specific restriction endonuclease McrA